mgnify:CR=1 FL=1
MLDYAPIWNSGWWLGEQINSCLIHSWISLSNWTNGFFYDYITSILSVFPSNETERYTGKIYRFYTDGIRQNHIKSIISSRSMEDPSDSWKTFSWSCRKLSQLHILLDLNSWKNLIARRNQRKWLVYEKMMLNNIEYTFNQIQRRCHDIWHNLAWN